MRKYLKLSWLSFCFCILEVDPSLNFCFFSLIPVNPNHNWYQVQSGMLHYTRKCCNFYKPIYLRQNFVFSSCSHAAALESEALFRHPFSVSKCLRLFDTSSSSSSLELQFDVTESYCVPSCSLAKWHSCSWEMSMLLLLLLEFPNANGPDLFAGVLWRAGDELLKGVWHLEVVELPSGVISVPTSLWWTSWTASVQASFMVPPAGCLNKNPSLVGSEYLKLGKTGSISSVNLSGFCT